MSDPEFQRIADAALAFTSENQASTDPWMDQETFNHGTEPFPLHPLSPLSFDFHSLQLPLPISSDINTIRISSGVGGIQDATLSGVTLSENIEGNITISNSSHPRDDPTDTNAGVQCASNSLSVSPTPYSSDPLTPTTLSSDPTSAKPTDAAVPDTSGGSLSGPDLLAATLAQNPGCLQGGMWNPLTTSMEALPSADSIASVVSSTINAGKCTELTETTSTTVALESRLAKTVETMETTETTETMETTETTETMETTETTETMETTETTETTTGSTTPEEPAKLVLRIPKLVSATKENMLLHQNQAPVSSMSVDKGVVGQLVSSRPKRARKEPPPREPTTIEERNTRSALTKPPPKRTIPEDDVAPRKKKKSVVVAA
ncbi:hypothetical protein C8R42DRAFT_723097 [Lentinula raphanica]|nr:hypothetical protein C8R42DRAFT_723097 [Lentinula raphanica]